MVKLWLKAFKWDVWPSQNIQESCLANTWNTLSNSSCTTLLPCT